MLKQIITYKDYDDNECVDTLYFNITKTELTEKLDLVDELTTLQNKLQGDVRDLTTDEVREVLNLVKTFIKLSYGIRSADGKRFSKSDDIWREFTETAAYDAFLFSLFDEPNKSVAFMLGVVPQDLREEAEKTLKSDTTPAYIREGRLPRPAELQSMSPEDLAVAMAHKNAQ